MLWQKAIGGKVAAGGGGAVSYVGGNSAVATTSISLTSLTGGLDTSPTPGDLVLVYVFVGSDDITITSSGYTQHAYQTISTTMLVASKIMGESPDTVVSYSFSREDVPRVGFAIVLRGGDYSSIATANATSGAIDPPQSPAFFATGSIVVFAGLSIASSSVLPTTSDDTIDFLASASSFKSQQQQSGCGLVFADSTFDPVAFTQAVTNGRWLAATVVVTPQ